MRRLVFVLALACVVHAQKAPRPREILDLVALANAAPPEFAADALIRIADSDKVADPAWKRELLEQALSLAPSAQYKVKRPNVSGRSNGAEGFLSYAFEMEMDTLSLQWRAIKAIYKIDPARGRKLLRELPPLRLDPLGCGESMIYDVSPFYEAVTEISRDQPLEFVEPFVTQINSHVQVEPVTHLIVSRKSNPRELERLTGEFTAALGQIDHDPRAFQFNLRSAEVLAQALQNAGIPPQAFITAYGEYLERHVSARQCHGSTVRNVAPRNLTLMQEYARRDTPVVASLWEILYKDREVQYDDEERPEQRFVETPESSKLMKSAFGLRNNSDGKPATDADKKGIEWQTRFQDFRNALDEWKEQTEATPRNYFYQKCLVEMMMLEAVPRSDTALRAVVVDGFTAFLASSPLRVASRIEWWRQARGTLENVPEAAASFARSQDAVMQLYVAMDRTLGVQKTVPPH